MTFFAHLLTLITAMITGVLPHTPMIQPTAHAQTSQVTITTSPTPAFIPSPIATSSPTLKLTRSHTYEPLIVCLGPDKKQFKTTKKQCEDFKRAWGTHPSITPAGGVAQKIGEHTYSMKFTPDDHMGTPQEVLKALNAYRNKLEIGSLMWDDKLASFAQTRANYFATKGGLDQHAGFVDYIHNQDGFDKLGFGSIGENSAYAGPLLAVHIIEWIFAGDEEHNSNQINPKWTHAGIGINNLGIDVIFGGGKR